MLNFIKEKELGKKLSLTKRALKIIYRVDKKFLPIMVIGSLADGVNPYIGLYMSSLIIDQLIGERNTALLAHYVAITILFTLILSIIGASARHYRDCRNRAIWNGQEYVLNEKVLGMDYEYIESAGIQNKRRGLEEIQHFTVGGGIVCVFYSMLELLSNGISLCFSIGFMISAFATGIYSAGEHRQFTIVGAILLGILLFMSVLLMYRNTVIGKKKEISITSKFRNFSRVGYFFIGHYLGSHATGKDVRMFNQYPVIQKAYDDFSKEINEMDKEFSAAESKTTVSNGIISTATGSLIYLYFAINALWGIFSIGSVVKYAGCTLRFSNSFTGFLSDFAKLYLNCQFLEPYFEFLDIQNVKTKGTLPLKKKEDGINEIEFKKVSFKYPNTDHYVIRDLSLKLKIGERMAVVGKNGSGKTTFIKLLCRLYDPTEGEILLNGIDIKKYDYLEYLSAFSVVFQDFNLLSASLAENVAANESFDTNKVLASIEKAGLSERVTSMPKGINTTIYKEFDKSGVEISGGEAQKLAIARALYKDSPFIVLDEPTAALDPISEYEIYSRFGTLVQDKTAIYISHRLSSCRFCDDIVVFDNGEIIQRGNHEKLLENPQGLYYNLWTAQAKYYNDEAEAI
jgi:ATP-binding cassette subfamily B protein